MRILAVVFPGLTPIDLIGPLSAWRFVPGYELQIAGPAPGPLACDAGFELVATHSYESCWSDPDVLLVPGGGKRAYDALDDDRMLDCLARIGEKSGWVTSVCTGGLLLAAAGLLEGYRAATYWHSRDLLAMFGAIPDEARVVVDRNRATGGGMTAGIDFGLHMVGLWAGDEAGRVIELAMEYAPQPPFGCGRPELADAQTRSVVDALLKTEMPSELAVAAAMRRGFSAVANAP